MTYTFKLSRRIAISRAMLPLLTSALLTACSGDESTSPTHNPDRISLSIFPGTATVEVDQPVEFGATVEGDSIRPSVQWEASGGTVDAQGRFTSSDIGTFRVVGRPRGRWFGSADTSTIVVVRRQPHLRSLKVMPGGLRIEPGKARQFRVTGKLKNGRRVPVGVKWSATGGAIDDGGRFVAGRLSGRYRVVATSVSGRVADTIRVKITGQGQEPDPTDPPPEPIDTIDPTPDPEPLPDPTLAGIQLKPAFLTVGRGQTAGFAAYGRTDSGDSVAVDVTFSATGGTVTSSGQFTAGSTPGSFRVVASHAASGLADTSSVAITAPATGGGGGGSSTGVPFGAFNARVEELPSPLNLSVVSGNPRILIDQLTTAKRRGMRLIVNFAGGSYDNNFGPDGTFSYDVWRHRVDRFLGLKLAPFIEDGTLFAIYLIDEPHDAGSWGGETVPYQTLERMAQYAKSQWPGLTTIIRTKVSWLNKAPFRWQYLDAGWSQFSDRHGDINTYRNNEVAASRASGLGLMFSMNILNGGNKGAGCVAGTREGNCNMRPEELKKFGTVLASAPEACGLTVWQYDPAYMNRPEIRAILEDIERILADRPAVSCKRR